MAHHHNSIFGIKQCRRNCGDGDPAFGQTGVWEEITLSVFAEHYCFYWDKELLRNEAYPVMKEAALFCFDWLVEKDGYLITLFIITENNF